MTRQDGINASQEQDLFVCFSSLAGFNKRFVLQTDDQKVFATMCEYFSWSGGLIQRNGGTVIKCIGDSILMVFPAIDVDVAVTTIRELKSAGDDWLRERGVPCQHYIKAHLGPAVMGPVGAPGQERLDVYGSTVNICATLEGGPLVITPQVFRALSSNTRKQFKKHTPPITYIRVEDAHR